jgi:hypothetical protein
LRAKSAETVLPHDAGAADEFAFDVELGDGGSLLCSLMPWRISESSSTFTAVMPLVSTPNASKLIAQIENG